MKDNNVHLSASNFDKIVDLIIRLGILFLLIAWCFNILKPFFNIMIWSIVIAVAIYPLHRSFMKFFKGRTVLSVVVLTAILLSVIIVPSFLVTYSMYDGIVNLRQFYTEGQPLIPPPGEFVKNWPSFAEPLITLWDSASRDLNEFTLKYSDQLKIALGWLLSVLGGVGMGILQLNISVIVAGVLLAYTDSLTIISKKIFIKLAGDKGEYFATVSVATIRNVVKGFLGVAIIQTTMAGIGFYMADIPLAGIWTILCLILAIVQIGAGPIAIPIVIYTFLVSDSKTAILLAIWMAIVLVSDNILKPILLT